MYHASPFDRGGRPRGERPGSLSAPQKSGLRGIPYADSDNPAASSASACELNHWKRTAWPSRSVQT